MLPTSAGVEPATSCRKKVKHQHTIIPLAILVDRLSPMIPAKIQPKGILSYGEEDF